MTHRSVFLGALTLLLGCSSLRELENPDAMAGRPSLEDTIGEPTFHPMMLVPMPELGRLDVGGAPLEALVGRESPVRDVLMALFRDSDINLMVDADVAGVVTFDVKNSTVEEAFEAILEDQDLAYEFDGTFLRVRNNERATILVDGIASSGTARGNSGGESSGSAGNSGGTAGSDSPIWSAIRQDVQDLVGGGRVIVNPTAGLITVDARPSMVRDVRRYVDDMVRRSTRQVSLEARILEVTLTDEFRLGVNWSLLPGFFNSNETGLAGGGGLVSQGAAAGADQFQFGFLRGGDLSIFVDALETQGQVRVLTSPRVSTMNNQTANIRVVDNIPVIDREVIDSTGGLRTQFDIRFVEAGVTLAVTPQIGEDGMITCSITPNVTEQVGTITTPDGLQTEPILATRTTTTSVQVPNGRGIVIGGLRTTRKSENLSGVPLLMDIPLLGALFRSTIHSRDEVELMVVLVPRVIDNTWREEDLRRGAHRLVSLRRPFRLGSLGLETMRLEDWDGATLGGVPSSVAASESEVRLAPRASQPAEASLTVTRRGLAGRLIRKGTDRLAVGDTVEAVRYFEAALGLAPDEVELLVTTGVLLGRHGRIPEGRRYLERAVRLRSDDPVVLSARGALDVRDHQPRAALRFLEAAHRLAAAPWSAVNFAGCLLQLERYDEARKLLVNFAKLDPEIPEFFINLAYAELKLEDPRAAQLGLNRALSLGASAENPRVHALQLLVDRAVEAARIRAEVDAAAAGSGAGTDEPATGARDPIR